MKNETKNKQEAAESCLTGCGLHLDPISIKGPEQYENRRMEFINLFGVDLNHVIKLISRHPTLFGEVVFPKNITWDAETLTLLDLKEFKKFHNLSTLSCLQTSIGIDENDNY